MCLAALPSVATAQVVSDAPVEVASEGDSSDHPALDFTKFLAGGALGFGLHETGHLIFDAIFDAGPHVEGVHFGPFGFFAITHENNMPWRQEYAIDSAGFWVQEATNEWLLTSRPNLHATKAPFAKGLFAFNVLASVGYGVVAFTKSGPSERDTRGMAAALGVDERTVGVMVLAPAIFDAIRYFKPDAAWARWASRIAKVAGVVVIFKQQ